MTITINRKRLHKAYIGDNGDERTLDLGGIVGGSVTGVKAVLKRKGVVVEIDCTPGAIANQVLPITLPLGDFLTGDDVAAGLWEVTFQVSFSSGDDDVTWGRRTLEVEEDPNPPAT